jgi:undecaprenyl-diphosphatase
MKFSAKADHSGNGHRATASDPLGEVDKRISATEVPPGQQLRRGRRFKQAYVSVLVLAIVAFLALALLVIHDMTLILRFDEPVATAIQGVNQPLYDWVLTHVSDLGWFPGNVISYVAVFVALFAARLRLEAVLAVVSSLLAGVVGGVLKQVVGRMRPLASQIHVTGHISGYSFPSGHVVQYTTLFGFAFYVVFVTWRGGLVRNLALAFLALLVVLVGPSRVYLGQHWPSDVLGAYLFAGLWLAGTIEAHLYLKSRFSQLSRRSGRPGVRAKGSPRQNRGSIVYRRR